MEGTKTAKGKFDSRSSLRAQELQYMNHVLIMLAETVQRIRQYIQSTPVLRHDKTKYVEGWGWDHTKWLQGSFPTAVRVTSKSD